MLLRTLHDSSAPCIALFRRRDAGTGQDGLIEFGSALRQKPRSHQLPCAKHERDQPDPEPQLHAIAFAVDVSLDFRADHLPQARESGGVGLQVGAASLQVQLQVEFDRCGDVGLAVILKLIPGVTVVTAQTDAEREQQRGKRGEQRARLVHGTEGSIQEAADCTGPGMAGTAGASAWVDFTRCCGMLL